MRVKAVPANNGTASTQSLGDDVLGKNQSRDASHHLTNRTAGTTSHNVSRLSVNGWDAVMRGAQLVPGRCAAESRVPEPLSKNILRWDVGGVLLFYSRCAFLADHSILAAYGHVLRPKAAAHV